MSLLESATIMRSMNKIKTPKCTNCGSTDPEDMATGTGYSACCNDRIEYV